ncbi:MAG: LysM peptidoglycan-binding domain-containing protein, partial [Elusimicrobia bacterium]|nr:LysM peptidoglycan-binding domain-containing protein [Elusimicrobiota bacterium]
VFNICIRFYRTWELTSRKKIPPAPPAVIVDTEKDMLEKLKQKAKQQIAVSGERIKLKKKEGYDVTDSLAVLKNAKNYYETHDYKNAIFYAREASDMLVTLKLMNVYTVKRGDSLWKISKKHYERGSNWYYIWKANKNKIRDFDIIYRGQEFIIPNFKQQNQS